MLKISQSGSSRLELKLRHRGSKTPSIFTVSDHGNNKSLGPVPHNESPTEAEATGTFLDGEPIAPGFMGMM